MTHVTVSIGRGRVNEGDQATCTGLGSGAGRDGGRAVSRTGVRSLLSALLLCLVRSGAGGVVRWRAPGRLDGVRPPPQPAALRRAVGPCVSATRPRSAVAGRDCAAVGLPGDPPRGPGAERPPRT